MINIKLIEKSVLRFEEWLIDFGNYSYDNADIISSDLGKKVKSYWLEHKIIGAPAMTLLHFSDILFPSLFKKFSSKNRHEIADAHFAMAFMGLYKYYNKKSFLDKSEKYINHLINNISKTDCGKGWGQPWDWVTPSGLVPKSNPVITNTAYCFNAINQFSMINNDSKYKNILFDVSEFAYKELKGEVISSDEEDAIYGYCFPAKAYNAMAYRASLLMHASNIFENDLYKESAKRNINHIISSQNKDGSWFYSKTSHYIDNIHSCFILKNLIDLNEILKSNRVADSIFLGYNYYKNNLIRPDGTLKHFSKVRFPKFRKIELYDYAEAINLEIEMNKIREQNFDILNSLSEQVVNNFQLEKGYFITRINSLNMKHRIPYLGWPQSQLFNSLIKLLNHVQ